MNQLFNPKTFEAKSKRKNSPTFAGGKYYLSVLVGSGYANHCRHKHKRASEAEAHAEKIRQYLIKRYEREIARAVASMQEVA